MKSDFHAIETDSPLVEGQTYIGLCGAEVKRAKFVQGWDLLEIGLKLRDLPKGICSKCRRQWEDMSLMHLEVLAERHFVYAIRSGNSKEDLESAA